MAIGQFQQRLMTAAHKDCSTEVQLASRDCILLLAAIILLLS